MASVLDTAERIGVTVRQGSRVHRVRDGFTACCGVALHRTRTAVPGDSYWPLCSRCFTAAERHAIVLRDMGRA
jgi:hypothetical protein